MDSVKERIHRSTISVQFYSRDNLQFRSKCKRVVLYVIRVTTTSDDPLSLSPSLPLSLLFISYCCSISFDNFIVILIIWFEKMFGFYMFVYPGQMKAIGINQTSVCFQFKSISLHVELDRYELSIFGGMLIFVCYHVIAYTYARCAFRKFSLKKYDRLLDEVLITDRPFGWDGLESAACRKKSTHLLFQIQNVGFSIDFD